MKFKGGNFIIQLLDKELNELRKLEEFTRYG